MTAIGANLVSEQAPEKEARDRFIELCDLYSTGSPKRRARMRKEIPNPGLSLRDQTSFNKLHQKMVETYGM